MKTLIRFILIFTIFEAYIACSQVNFAVDESLCADTANCVTSKGMLRFEDSYFVGGGKIDILIVNDNSASMSTEQKKLAEKFNLFIEKLEDRFVDYRIAITTTDISNKVDFGSNNNAPRDINKNGALQDGNLLVFPNGQSFLEPVSWDLKGAARQTEIAKQVSAFKTTLVSPQTLQCEQFIANWVTNHNNSLATTNSTEYGQEYYKNCPSGDERGIYAAQLVLEKNSSAFIRPDAHLVMIFLSDENIRSDGISTQGGASFDFVDLSDGLVEKFNAKFQNTGKNFKAHSLVVKDDSCLAQQNNQVLGTPPVNATKGFVRGSIGHEYLLLSQKTGGVSGDICASDYTSQISDMEVQTKNLPIVLKCSQAKDVAVQLLDATGTVIKDLEFEIQGSELKIKDTFTAGTEISIVQFCDPSLINK